jgi:hypothetical protein
LVIAEIEKQNIAICLYSDIKMSTSSDWSSKMKKPKNGRMENQMTFRHTFCACSGFWLAHTQAAASHLPPPGADNRPPGG